MLAAERTHSSEQGATRQSNGKRPEGYRAVGALDGRVLMASEGSSSTHEGAVLSQSCAVSVTFLPPPGASRHPFPRIHRRTRSLPTFPVFTLRVVFLRPFFLSRLRPCRLPLPPLSAVATAAEAAVADPLIRHAAVAEAVSAVGSAAARATPNFGILTGAASAGASAPGPEPCLGVEQPLNASCEQRGLRRAAPRPHALPRQAGGGWGGQLALTLRPWLRGSDRCWPVRLQRHRRPPTLSTQILPAQVQRLVPPPTRPPRARRPTCRTQRRQRPHSQPPSIPMARRRGTLCPRRLGRRRSCQPRRARPLLEACRPGALRLYLQTSRRRRPPRRPRQLPQTRAPGFLWRPPLPSRR